jgi:hypothetical protein
MITEMSQNPTVPSNLSSAIQRGSYPTWMQAALVSLAAVGLLATLLCLQIQLDQRNDQRTGRLESLKLLPRGEVLRPALLGFHHFGADLVWLRIVQMLGEEVVSDRDYEWLYHALDVVTTLDPQYAYVHDAGGTILAEYANRVDLSNQLLEKGLKANPASWRLPFVLGFNHFFHLQNYLKAGEYMGMAAKIPGRPYYVDTLAARLFVEGGSPSMALQYLDVMLKQTNDPRLKEVYTNRYREVLIARDLRILDAAVAQYRKLHGPLVHGLPDLVNAGLLAAIPEEPFGGEYRWSTETGEVVSSTHPERLHLYRPHEARGGFRFNF